MKVVDLKILNKEFKINCPEGAEEQLYHSALYLEKKMQDIRNNGRVISLEKIAIIAALNLSHELLTQRQQKETYIHSVTEQIERLQDKLEKALQEESLSK